MRPTEILDRALAVAPDELLRDVLVSAVGRNPDTGVHSNRWITVLRQNADDPAIEGFKRPNKHVADATLTVVVLEDDPTHRRHGPGPYRSALDKRAPYLLKAIVPAASKGWVVLWRAVDPLPAPIPGVAHAAVRAWAPNSSSHAS